MPATFSPKNFRKLCDKLSVADPDLGSILETYGYPPMWNRPNTFETLVHIILEQQVSLASALAALTKLREKVKEIVPEKVLQLSDEELKACYFSRQKTVYVRSLAQALVNGTLDLKSLENLPDDEIRVILNKLKGIGNWTVDIYLIFVLQRSTIFPMGDLAAVNALKQLKKMPKDTPRENLLEISEGWKPYQTVATMILWHYYLSLRIKTPTSLERKSGLKKNGTV